MDFVAINAVVVEVFIPATARVWVREFL